MTNGTYLISCSVRMKVTTQARLGADLNIGSRSTMLGLSTATLQHAVR